MREKKELSKLEQQRLKRDARINALKAKDGGKKEIRSGSRLGRILFPLVALLLLVLGATWLAFATGFAQSMMSPLSVGSEKIGMKEFNFYYKNVYENTSSMFLSYQMAPAGADGKLDVTAACNVPGYEGKTWRDYVMDQAVEQIKKQKALETMAAEKGFSFSAEEQTQLDKIKDGFLARYPQEAERNKALESMYGRGMSLDYVLDNIKKSLIIQRFEKEYPQSFKLSDEEISQYYDAHKDEMDYISYRRFVFQPPLTAETDEAKAQAKESNKAKAVEMLAEISDAESFKTAAVKYAADEQKAAYQADDLTETQSKGGSIYEAEVKSWLLDPARKAGDKTSLSSGNSEYVLFFEGREKGERKLPSVRHILIGDPKAQKNPDEAQLAKDKTTAEELAAKIKSEEDMIKLGEEMQSAGTAREVQRYDNIAWKQMDIHFNDWIFDPARKAGDVGVVQSRFGYHVIYFAGWNELPEWKYSSDQALRQERFKAEEDAFIKEERFNTSTSSFAMKYVS